MYFTYIYILSIRLIESCRVSGSTEIILNSSHDYEYVGEYPDQLLDKKMFVFKDVVKKKYKYVSQII